MAAFERLAKQIEYDGVVSKDVKMRGFEFKGQRITLMGLIRGIWKSEKIKRVMHLLSFRKLHGRLSPSLFLLIMYSIWITMSRPWRCLNV